MICSSVSEVSSNILALSSNLVELEHVGSEDVFAVLGEDHFSEMELRFDSLKGKVVVGEL